MDILTEQQFNEFEIANTEIEDIHNIRRLLGFVKANDRDVIEYLQETANDFVSKSSSWNGVKRNDSERAFLNINRLFLNYLSSIRTFLDHSETYLNRKLGIASPEFLEFKKLLSFFYDNSFAYRFFYKLRNYSQHVGLPIDSFSFTAQYEREQNRIKGTLNLAFDRDKLLSSYDSWGIVKNDLQEKTPAFDVTPLVFEMTHNLTEIERNIELLLKDELLKAANFITKLTNHLQDGKSEIFVAYDFKSKDNGELANYKSINIPFDTVNFIRTELT